MTTTAIVAEVSPDGASLVVTAPAGAPVSVIDAVTGDLLAEGTADEDGLYTAASEELVGGPTLAGWLLLTSSGDARALAFDRRPLLRDVRDAACELAGGCGRPLWLIERFLLLRGMEAAAETGDTPRAARLWRLTGWDGAPGRPGRPRAAGGCGCHAR